METTRDDQRHVPVGPHSMAADEHALLPRVRELPADVLVVADGFSCKTQIEQGGTGRRALHLAEVIELARDEAGRLGDFPERRSTATEGAGDEESSD